MSTTPNWDVPDGDQRDPEKTIKTSPVPVTPTEAEPAAPFDQPPDAAASGYEILGELAQGGMGIVYRARQRSLEREVAIKKIRPDLRDEAVMQREFLAEGRITGLLDHPNIVPVHDLGRTTEGEAFLAMKLVTGTSWRTLLHPESAAERAAAAAYDREAHIEILLNVGNAVAFAHSRGILHRDLKPENVMVGPFGEVLVMDWGVAMKLPDQPAAVPAVAGDATLMICGTPAYMAPEMAEARVEDFGPWTDVYLLGAVLHEILTGSPPHPGPDLRTVLEAARRSDPPVYPADVPDELASIGRTAMARNPRDRYPTVAAFQAAVRGHLRHRESLAVASAASGLLADCSGQAATGEEVRHCRYDRLAEAIGGFRQALALWDGNEAARAGERQARLAYARAALAGGDLNLAAMHLEGLTGPEAAEVDEKVRAATLTRAHGERRARRLRRALVAAIGVIVVGLTVGVILVDHERQRADDEARQSRRNEITALAALADVERLSDAKRLGDLEARAEALWPPHPDQVPALGAWIDEARDLLARAPRHQAALEALRQGGLGTVERQWRNDLLVDLLRRLEAFDDRASGTLASVQARREFAATVKARSIDDHAAAWDRDRDYARASGRYPGFDLVPQLGLVPLGPDPASRLLEFLHLQSHDGPLPERDGEGRLKLRSGTGIILILLPGGRFLMGAQSADRDEPHFDPQAERREAPVHEVTLAPFFMAKYETTQGQWLRIMGTNPSLYGPEHATIGSQFSLLHPAEQLSWGDAAAFARRTGLVMPTEAQWEYAARGGTDTVWFTGDEQQDLARVANLSDQYLRGHGGSKDWPYAPFDDGNALHAEVGSYAANPFGLHDVYGNVAEWCREGFQTYREEVAGPDGERLGGNPAERIFRGGGCVTPPQYARSANRNFMTGGTRDDGLGVRFARPLDGR